MDVYNIGQHGNGRDGCDFNVRLQLASTRSVKVAAHVGQRTDAATRSAQGPPQDAALARMAAETAAREANRGAALFEIAAAKLISNQAAARATKACHQAHGAMGMTQEYPLHHLSRRLWSWRKEYGGEAEWSRWLGSVACDQGADGL